MKFDKVREELLTYPDLEDDWDSYGAKVINPKAITTASMFIPFLEAIRYPEPTIFPIPDGGIVFEWKRTNYHLNIEINPEGTWGAIFVELEPGNYQEKEAPITNQDIVDELQKFRPLRGTIFSMTWFLGLYVKENVTK